MDTTIQPAPAPDSVPDQPLSLQPPSFSAHHPQPVPGDPFSQTSTPGTYLPGSNTHAGISPGPHMAAVWSQPFGPDAAIGSYPIPHAVADEVLIVAEGLNESEWLKSLALCGRPNCNTHMQSPLILAREVALRQHLLNGQVEIDAHEGAFIMLRLLKAGSAYFRNATLPDAQAILSAIDSFRVYLDPAVDEVAGMQALLADGVVPSKNAGLLELFARYLEALTAENRIDHCQLLRLVASRARPLEARIWTVLERPLSPLAEAMLLTLSGGADPARTTLWSLNGLPEPAAGTDVYTNSHPNPPPTLHIDRIVSAYGESNEVEAILKDILANAGPLDNAIIALTSAPAYAQLLFDSARRHAIPMTFASGVPIANSGAAKVLVGIRLWAGDGIYRGDTLARLIGTECFAQDRLTEYGRESEREVLDWCLENGCLDGERGDRFCRASIEGMAELAGRLALSFDGSENAKRLDRLETHLQDQLIALQDGASAHPQPRRQRETVEKLASFDLARRFFNDVARGPAAFLAAYTNIRTDDPQLDRLDKAALQALTQELALFEERGCGLAETLAAIPSLLTQNVAGENSRPGHVHVCGIEAAQGIRRGHLYVTGLSADGFPGKQRENPILLDDDYARAKRFWEARSGRPCVVPESGQRLEDNESALRTLLRLATARGTRVSLSFSSFNLSEQKPVNPAGILLELYQACHGADQSSDNLEKAMERVGYFEPPLFFDETQALMHAVRGGRRLDPDDFARAQRTARLREARRSDRLSAYDGLIGIDLTNQPFSPSMLETLLKCPYRFFVQHLLGIDEPEQAGDAFTWLNHLEIGTLVHEAIETYSRQPRPPQLEDRLQSIRAIGDGLLEKMALEKIPHAAPVKQQALIRQLLNWFVESDPDDAVAAVEQSVGETVLGGIRVRGRLDRLERTPGGEAVVVDYKTGGFISQDAGDPGTCLQVLLYCAMLAADRAAGTMAGQASDQEAGTMAGQGVALRGEYRYLKRRKTVSVAFDGTRRAALDGIMERFAHQLGTGQLPMPAGNDNCTYCAYGAVCCKRAYDPEALAGKWASVQNTMPASAQAPGRGVAGEGA